MYKIGYENLYIDIDSQDKLVRMLAYSINKRKEPKKKEPKGSASDGAYCPKLKTGQSWAHVDKSKEEDENGTTLSDNTEN